MNIYIVSDFHLKFKENELEKSRRYKVLSFLKSLVGKADVLILNGDIFDLWFVWQKVIIKDYFPILKILADLNENGCRLIFIAGNHDFWFRDFLTDYLHCEVYPEYFVANFDGLKYFVAHGDLFTNNDKRYRIFRAMIRNKLIMKLFEILHPDFALNLGSLLSRSSRRNKISQDVLKRREEGLRSFAEKKTEDFDLVVLGHSHNPQLIKFSKGIYVNTGDWLENSSFLKIIDGKIELIT